MQNNLCLTGIINKNDFYEQSFVYPIHYVYLIINFQIYALINSPSLFAFFPTSPPPVIYILLRLSLR